MRIINIIALIFLLSIKVVFGQLEHTAKPKFNMDMDLLLVHYDCKTDVDDLHSVAAFATLLNQSAYSKLKYHAVAGTYGMQNGLYVPPNDLFALAFGNNWSDAHNDYESALETVQGLVFKTLDSNGTIWIAEAGQSDFSADLIGTIKAAKPNLEKKQIQIVQHSDWNEEVTTPKKLDIVKSTATYHKIADGNATQNGTPGFRSEEITPWSESISDKHLNKVWELAIKLGNQYNGAQNRYLNKSIEKGGLDFSDFSEVCWILGLEGLRDANAYFGFIASDN